MGEAFVISWIICFFDRAGKPYLSPADFVFDCLATNVIRAVGLWSVIVYAFLLVNL